MKEENLIYGKHPLIEALKAGKPFEKILLQNGTSNAEMKELSSLARHAGIPVQYVPHQKLNKVTRNNHQGMIGFGTLISYYDLQDILMQCYDLNKVPLFLLLDRVTDVRNFGAIARTAECCGASAIVVPATGGALIHADAIKASAGALNLIPVCKVNRLEEAVDLLTLNGLQILVSEMDAEKNLHEVDFSAPTAIIMGSEGEGVSGKLASMANDSFKIPMIGATESLNVSVAAGMVLYEAVRQRLVKG
ncbi:23S rRNA (guanosine(2251)-2'-O)-methyltransferase RlmB [soil metagenome]